MKKVRPGTFLKALTGGRIRHTRVQEVTDQDTISARIYQGEDFPAEREASTKTRGTIFAEVEEE
jgi:hypothetical protein